MRDVLARSTITATSVKLPEGQLERKLYEQVNKALAGSGGRWDRKSGTHAECLTRIAVEVLRAAMLSVWTMAAAESFTPA